MKTVSWRWSSRGTIFCQQVLFPIICVK